jgi:hypothetical protein
MSGYTKLFHSIIASTIWQEDLATKVVWITMLALADRDGVVEATVPGLAHLAGVTREQVETALEKFLAPDPDSRSKAQEGRRIEAFDGCWHLVNFDAHQMRMSPEDVRYRGRLRKQRYRDHLKSCPTKSGTKRDKRDKGHLSHEVRHVDVDVDVDVDAKKKPFLVPPEAVGLAEKLRFLILENKPDSKMTDAQVKEWGKEADQMLRLDGRTPAAALELLEWCQHDSFCCGVILSMKSFRKHYDQLTLKRQDTPQGRANRKAKESNDHTARMIQRHLARAPGTDANGLAPLYPSGRDPDVFKRAGERMQSRQHCDKDPG